MEAALYDPEGGYYARGAAIGERGSFTTAPVATRAFARALATDLRGLHARLGRPAPFTLVEVGPGTGALARGLADALSDLPLELVLCERAEGMLARTRAVVPEARVAALDELAPVVGAIVANEVHDACPAHRLRFPDELLVDVGPDRRFRLVSGGPAEERLVAPLLAAGVTPRQGAEYEVAPAQAELQSALARRLARGALVVFDYGEAGPLRYTRPVPRLRTYVAGRPGGDPLAAPGSQDITVDVDFGAVRRAGEAAGLHTVADRDQAGWLREHGALEQAAALAREDPERLWLEALAREGASGSAFRLLWQERQAKTG